MAAVAADVTFTRVRSGLSADVADLRGVACMESVERTRYASRSGLGASCADLITAAGRAPRGPLQWRSRLRLDVTAGSMTEEFSLTDASRFERNDIGGLLAAATAGSGEFSIFLQNLIAANPESFQARGTQQTSIGPLSAFTFASLPMKGTAYRGTLFVTSDSADLRRITMEADNAGESCRVQYTTDYATTRLGERYVLVPRNSTMLSISKDGSEYQTDTYYSGCRRPAPPAVSPAAADLKPIPPGIRFRVRFQPSIESATAATGDPVTAVIRTTVKDKQKEIIIHAGDRLHGRIALIEQQLVPQPRWNVAVVFETIERGVGERGIDQGVEQPVSLVQVDEAGSPEAQKLRPPNGGYFVFGGASAQLASETEWETR